MKKSLLVIVMLCFIASNPLLSQGLLNKVKKAVSKEISSVIGDDTGKESSNPGPEPSCACDDANLIMDLGKYKVLYNEITICTKMMGASWLKTKWLASTTYQGMAHLKDHTMKEPLRSPDFAPTGEKATIAERTMTGLQGFPIIFQNQAKSTFSDLTARTLVPMQ